MRARAGGSRSKVTRKETDDRYFAIVNESGTILLTWGKKDDAATMSKSEQRFQVDQIVATWTGQVDEETGETVPSFNLQLPKDTGAYAKDLKKAAKLDKKGAKKKAKEEAKRAKEKAKAASGTSPLKRNVATLGSGGLAADEAGQPEPEPEPAEEEREDVDDVPPPADDAEEGEPPEDGEGAEGQQVEISVHKNDEEGGFRFCRFMERLYAGGAKVEGDAPAEVESMHGLTILQDGERADGVEFKIDDDNCITDFKGSMLKSKGITLGLKLGKINSTVVLGW